MLRFGYGSSSGGGWVGSYTNIRFWAALFFPGTVKPIINSCRFISNTARYGSGIYNECGSLNVNNSAFIANDSAAAYGRSVVYNEGTGYRFYLQLHFVR